MSSFDLPGSPGPVAADLDSSLAMDPSSQEPMVESFSASDAKHFPVESVKVMAESIGFSGLSDEAARELAEDATFRIKTLIQDAHKFMVHARRKQLLCEDVDLALKSEGENENRVAAESWVKWPKSNLCFNQDRARKILSIFDAQISPKKLRKTFVSFINPSYHIKDHQV